MRAPPADSETSRTAHPPDLESCNQTTPNWSQDHATGDNTAAAFHTTGVLTL